MFPAEKYFAGANTAVGRSGAYRLRCSRTDTAQYRQADKGNLGALDRHIDVALRLMSQRYKIYGVFFLAAVYYVQNGRAAVKKSLEKKFGADK